MKPTVSSRPQKTPLVRCVQKPVAQPHASPFGIVLLRLPVRMSSALPDFVPARFLPSSTFEPSQGSMPSSATRTFSMVLPELADAFWAPSFVQSPPVNQMFSRYVQLFGNERVGRLVRVRAMEVLELLPDDGKAQLVADGDAVEADTARRPAGRLVHAAAHAQDDGLRMAGDDGAARDVETHGAHDLAALLDDPGDHGVLADLDALGLQDLLRSGMTVVLRDRFVIADVIQIVPVAFVDRPVITVEHAELFQLLVHALGFLYPDLRPVLVADVLSASDMLRSDVIRVVAHLRVEPAVGADKGAQAGIAGAALVDDHDGLSGFPGRHGGHQAREAAANDQDVALVFRLPGRRDLRGNR